MCTYVTIGPRLRVLDKEMENSIILRPATGGLLLREVPKIA